ncbi:WD40-repeat-containing domain protein [Lineolata rhizophorae]|uniref:WD40-repeat-containing domain protein n=1 Tax=Lineolata rhizophorae TaxID=578093 RepID=A0A6A6NUU8_9PEZI|nr:WD40-repeat-containing domain protein [Lineolata rhizophorae]
MGAIKYANGSSSGGKGALESNGSHANGSRSGAIVSSPSRLTEKRAALPPTFFGHDREEVTRILIQGLHELGYDGAATTLSRESGYELEGPVVAAFRAAVLAGEWAEAEALLFGVQRYGNADGDGGGGGLGGEGWPTGEVNIGFSKNRGKGIYVGDGAGAGSWPGYQHQQGGLPLAEAANKNEMLFWLRQQKYLELLERRDLDAALAVLRQELQPFAQATHDVGRLHQLSSLIMCASADDVRYQAQWTGAEGDSRAQLLSALSRYISPSVMIPEHRLAILLDQVKGGWISNCLYHNTSTSPSLYVDHMCDPDEFPLQTILELRDHTDEVWFLAFSNNGDYLATTSKDHTICIYETRSYKLVQRLEDHESGVCYVAWSPDDSKLISCAQARDNSARVWDVRTGRCILLLSSFTYPVTSAAWAPSGETFVIGSQDADAALCVWNLDGDKVFPWREDGLRVHDVAMTPDGSRLVVLLETRILVFDLASKDKLADFALDNVKLTSVNVSRNGRYMLVSMNDNKIRLMEIETGEVVQTYDGHRQTQFIIRSAFGGADENFIVSGSEDSRVYVWRTNGPLVTALDAHKPGCVNAVAWHPTDPRVFASAGDDSRVRMYVTFFFSSSYCLFCCESCLVWDFSLKRVLLFLCYAPIAIFLSCSLYSISQYSPSSLVLWNFPSVLLALVCLWAFLIRAPNFADAFGIRTSSYETVPVLDLSSIYLASITL